MFTQKELPFSTNSMLDFCSEETFEYHYGKHHAGYIKKLNKAIEGTDFIDMSLEDIIKKSYKEQNLSIFNNAAQHFNHDFFWNSLSSQTQKIPESIIEKINKSFDSFEKFKEEFSNKASTLFASGWVWLVLDADTFEIIQTHNAETPIIENKIPLLTLDIWEHAYYIDYRNNRTDYITKFFDHIHWEKVKSRIID